MTAEERVRVVRSGYVFETTAARPEFAPAPSEITADSVSLGGIDLSAFVAEVTVTTERESVEVTRMGDAEPRYIPGPVECSFTMRLLGWDGDGDLMQSEPVELVMPQARASVLLHSITTKARIGDLSETTVTGLLTGPLEVRGAMVALPDVEPFTIRAVRVR